MLQFLFLIIDVVIVVVFIAGPWIFLTKLNVQWPRVVVFIAGRWIFLTKLNV